MRGGRTPPRRSSARSSSAAAGRAGAGSRRRTARASAIDAAVCVGVLAEAEQEVVADRMEVGGVALDLELAEHRRLPRIGEVERVERVDLLERDEVCDVAGEPHRVDALAATEAANPSQCDELSRLGLERGDEALAVATCGRVEPGRGLGARHPQHAALLGERPLAEEEAGHLAARAVGRARRIRDVELVQRGSDALGHDLRALRKRAVRPPLGGDVQALRRGVDDASVREHGVGVDGHEALVEIDREHRDQSEAGEVGRPLDVAALDEGALPLRPGAPVADDIARQPARDARRGDDGAVSLRRGGSRLGVRARGRA